MFAEENRNPTLHRTGTSNSAVGPTGKSSALPAAPPGHHPPRRSMTVDDRAQFRRRATTGQFSMDNAFESPRRDSITSDYSLSERRRSLQDDILNPGGASLENHEGSHWSSLPLAFALLPAVGGLFFKNGSSIVTDIMLLGLAAVFLHWSVTQPWIWYHSAQEIRVREEAMAGMMDMDDEIEEELPSRPPAGAKSSTLNGAHEEVDGPTPETQDFRQEALNELYTHEVMALASCFFFPLLGAFLLHTIRNQLSRPSEGLVSNYNLTIFLLAAEIHPLGHLIKMVQARTLHLQRIVHSNPYNEASPASGRIEDVMRRLEELESRVAESRTGASHCANGIADPGKQAKQDGNLVREVRNAIQPELDALNRAVRHYEKRTTMLALQTDSRLGAIDTRLNDAISLAAAAAKTSISRRSFLSWLTERLVEAVMGTPRVIFRAAVLPFRVVSNLLSLDSKGRHRKGPRDRRVGRDRVTRTWG